MSSVPTIKGNTPGGLSTFYSVGKRLVTRGPRNAKKQWDVLNGGGVCTGCSLGMCGDTDERGDMHLCYQGMKRLNETTYPEIPDAIFSDVSALRKMSTRELSTLGRVTHPLVLRSGDAGFQRLAWDDALALVADRIEATSPDRMAFYMSGRSSNEAIYVTQLFARLLGTTNIDNCSRYCHAPSSFGLAEVFGNSSGTSSLDDIHETQLIFIIGSNTPSQHPRLLKNIGEARKNGAEIVVVNPIVERGLIRYAIPSDIKSTFMGTDIASLYITPKVGGDIAFMMGVLKIVADLDGFDHEFLSNHTDGWTAFEDSLNKTSFETLVEASGVSRTEMEQIGKLYCSVNRAMILYCMGLTHHTHGTDNVRMVANLMLARGNVGRPGTGIVPIRGHSNVQGAGEMMMIPALSEIMSNRMRDRYGESISRNPGMTTSEMVHAGHNSELGLAYLVGGNLLEASPDTKYTRKAFERIPTIVSQTIHLNKTHLVENEEMIILPAQPRHEQQGGGSVISNWRHVRFSPKILKSKGESEAEWAIPIKLAKLLAARGEKNSALAQLEFSDVADIQKEIAAVIPGFGELPGLQEGESFQLGGKSLHSEGIFGHTNGKAKVPIVSIPDTTVPEGHFQMISVRADGQFNTEITEESDSLRRAKSRDIILMNATDASEMDMKEDTAVVVSSRIGSLSVSVHIIDIRVNVVAMYFPEANALIPWDDMDRDTKTPNFKGTCVQIKKAA